MPKDIQSTIARANEALRLAQSNKLEEGIQLLETLIDEHPGMIGARSNLGALLDQAGRCERACEVLKEAIRLQPGFAEAWNNLGLALFHLTRTQAATDAFTRAVRIKPDYFEAHSNRCLMPLYRTGTITNSKGALTDWRHACETETTTPRTKGIGLPKNSLLKIGFVSPDFRVHSVAYFLLPLIRHWSTKKQVEIFLYSDVGCPDDVTESFRSLPVHYIPVRELSHRELAEKVRHDGIHVLFDLCGHFTHNRLPVFAMRAAPCQLAWLGYPCDSGTPHIDYRIADKVSSPPELSSNEPESILRLNRGYHCYSPPLQAPAIEAMPFAKGAAFTFGCFNNAFKISPEIARIWGVILQQSPKTRLLLKAKSFANDTVRQQILDWIHTDPTVRNRVQFRCRDASLQDHLATYNTVDLALDTFPYNGTTTTCESLWMGVPCITLCGSEPQSRVGASLLHQAKLNHFVTHSAEQYIQVATLLAHQADKLKSYRSVLRSHLSQTPLLNPEPVCEELLEQVKKLTGFEHRM